MSGGGATIEMGQEMPRLFREAFPRHAAKIIASIADVPHETARNWVRGRSEPSITQLLAMTRECDELRAAVLRALQQSDR